MRHLAYKTRGFTMIELMIVIVIISILAAISMPMYNDQVRKSRRTDAQRALISWVQALERQYTAGGAYGGCAAGWPPPSDYYIFNADVCTAASFTISATPRAGTSQVDDGVMSLNHEGRRLPADKWSN